METINKIQLINRIINRDNKVARAEKDPTQVQEEMYVKPLSINTLNIYPDNILEKIASFKGIPLTYKDKTTGQIYHYDRRNLINLIISRDKKTSSASGQP